MGSPLATLGLLLTFLSAARASVPYSGGTGDGFHVARLSNHPLGGATQPAFCYLGGGSGGDGFAGWARANHPLDPPPVAGTDLPYLAGSGGGDGFGSQLLANWRLGPSADPAWNVIARAGTGGGDGFSAGAASNTSGLPPSPPYPYLAGQSGGDGFGADGRANSGLGASPDYASELMAKGGSADGFGAALLFNGTFVPPADPLELVLFFSGGGGADGFDGARLTGFNLSGAAFPLVQYGGGVGDGFASMGLANRLLENAPISTLPSLGGSADGFDARKLSNWPMEYRFGSPATYAIYQAALFTPAQIETGLADPNADADGDGVANLLEFALGTNPLGGYKAPLHAAVASPAEFGGVDDGNYYLTFGFNISPFALGIVIEAEFSDNLEMFSWSSDGSVLLISLPDWVVLRDGVPAGIDSPRFGRLKVRLLP